MYAELQAGYVVRKLCIGLVRMYQVAVSPFLPGSCRFIPSCSEYAIEAFALHGFFRGLGLTLGRVLRCHPLARGGLDPVPEIEPVGKGDRSTCAYALHSSAGRESRSPAGVCPAERDVIY